MASAVARKRSIRASSSNVLRNRLRGFQRNRTLPMSKTTIKGVSCSACGEGVYRTLLAEKEFAISLGLPPTSSARPSSTAAFQFTCYSLHMPCCKPNILLLWLSIAIMHAKKSDGHLFYRGGERPVVQACPPGRGGRGRRHHPARQDRCPFALGSRAPASAAQ